MKNSSKMGKKLVMYLFVMIFTIMVILTLSVTMTITKKTKENTINNMKTITAERSQIIQNYVLNAAKTLIFYGEAGEIRDIIKNPEDPVATKNVQSYTESFSKNIDGIEGLYVSEWNSHVLAHSNPSAVGMTTKEGDALKSFQQIILNNKGKIGKCSIVKSPTSDSQVIAMTRGIYDEKDEPIGLVGYAANTENLISTLDNLPMDGIKTANYYMVNVNNKQYIFNPDKEKVATEVDNPKVQALCEKFATSSTEETGYIEYTEKGVSYISTYYYMPTNGWLFMINTEELELFALSKNMGEFLTIFCLSALIVMTLVAYLVIKKITAPLYLIEKDITELQNYDIRGKELETYKNRKDEIGNICNGIVLLKGYLSSLIKNIQDATSELNGTAQKFSDKFTSVSSGISETNKAISEMANGATNQAQETTDAKNKVESIVENINAQTDNTKELLETSNNLSQAATGVKDTLEKLIQVFNENDKSVNLVAEQTAHTKDSANQITVAIGMISDIANQTNLLSLNASIEAARAGEQGKGFAVVADEIRKLAEQSNESAQNIASVIEALIKNSEESVGTMAVVKTNNKEQMEQLKSTRGSFDNMMGQLDKLIANINQMNVHIEGITKSVNALSGSIIALANISEENAASCEETSANMSVLDESIAACVDELNQLVQLGKVMEESAQKFKI